MNPNATFDFVIDKEPGGATPAVAEEITRSRKRRSFRRERSRDHGKVEGGVRVPVHVNVQVDVA